ncbi:MAG: hypothetical protein PVI01_12525 [Gemmatimonadales bacterium]|jgi:hypothetical protein
MSTVLDDFRYAFRGLRKAPSFSAIAERLMFVGESRVEPGDAPRRVIGLATGIVAAYGLTRLLRSMLFGVEPTDPITFGLVWCFWQLCRLRRVSFPRVEPPASIL